MSGIKEKDILENIKQSVEAETPDIWEKIQDTEKCIHDFEVNPLKSKRRKAYMSVAASFLIIITAFAGLKMNLFGLQNNGQESYTAGNGQNSSLASITPGVPGTASDSIGNAVAPDIAQQFTSDADEKEASNALKFDIAVPSWVPGGFTKVSSKLYSFNKDGSQPYMYNIEYTNDEKKLLTISITKYMTDEEKLKTLPDPMPEPLNKGVADNTSNGNVNPPDTALVRPVPPPNSEPQSVPGYNPSEPSAPTAGADKPSSTVEGMPTPQDPVIGSGSSSSSGSSGTAISGKPVSVDFTNVKVKGTDVSLTVTSSEGYKAVSAFWIYNGGNYNIYSDSVSKDDVIKIIESMLK